MKFLTTAALAALATGTTVEALARPSVAPKNVQSIAPALADYTDKVLFGDVWLRPELSPRDRSLVTVSALIATGKTPQLTGHLNRALANGLLPSEIAGVVTHLAFYTGWPNAVSAINVVEEVFAARKVEVPLPRQPEDLRAVGKRTDSNTGAQIAAVAPKLAQLMDEVIDEDLWRRADLKVRDRSLVTIAALTANDDTDQLAFEVRRGMENGLTRTEIGEALTHLAFYAGVPRAVAAAEIAGTVLAKAKDVDKAADARLIVVKPGTDVRAAPGSNFSGSVSVASPFKGTGDSQLGGATVTFQSGARTNWHTHPRGQLLVVTDGEGWVQAEGEAVRTVRKGDVVWTAPGVRHWHGATLTIAMTHVAIAEAVDGKSVEWAEAVTTEHYHGP